jgi:hypothetical protein
MRTAPFGNNSSQVAEGMAFAFSTTTGIAIYAALIATGGLAVQLVRAWRTWSTRLTVEVRPRMSVVRPGTALTGESEPVVVFAIINHSDHLAKVTHLSVEPIKDDGKSILFAAPFPAGTPGPWEVPPHDSITLYQPEASFADGDRSRTTRARVSTSDGKTFRSKPVALADLMPEQLSHG